MGNKGPYKEINPLYGSRKKEVSLLIPSNLRMLCAMLDVKPEKLLHDFMWTVSESHHKCTEPQRIKAKDYFLECGYGQELYPKEDILQMFKELEAIRSLWIEITHNNRKAFDQHIRWQHMYIEYWFEKWFNKVRRKEGVEILDEY